VRGEVVEVYSFVCAAGCEDYFLSLLGEGRGRGTECESSDGRGVRGEEEGVGELDFLFGGYTGSNAVEDAVVGASYDLEGYGSLRWFRV